MPSITRTRTADSQDARRPAIEERLLEATETLLADGTPYTRLSVGKLCREAGIARSTFYVYFRDKGDLVAHLAERMVGQLSAAASAWWEPGSDREDLLAATRRLVMLYREHTALFAALTETAAYDADLRALQEEIVRRHASPLRELIEHGRREGAGVRDVPATETVSALAWMLQGSCYHLAPDAPDAEVDRLAEALTSIIWHALYPDPAPSVPRSSP